jgi:hypothetical protein
MESLVKIIFLGADEKKIRRRSPWHHMQLALKQMSSHPERAVYSGSSTTPWCLLPRRSTPEADDEG